jgi:hypothetical protein
MFKIGQVVLLYNQYEATIKTINSDYIQIEIYKDYSQRGPMRILHPVWNTDFNNLIILKGLIKESKLPEWF